MFACSVAHCSQKRMCHHGTKELNQTYFLSYIHLVSEYGRRPLRSSTDRTLTVPRTHNRFGDALLLQGLVCGTVCR